MLSKGKRLFFIMLLGSTVTPYVLSTTDAMKKATSYFSGGKAENKEAAEQPIDPLVHNVSATLEEHKPASQGLAPPRSSVTARPTPAIHPMEDALRFDVTTDWVVSQWPRVSANLAELDVQGYRVPLVSGTTDADIAGSLTYYFDAKQKLERITFFGTTGDARKLVALLESRFGFKRASSTEPNLFLYQVKSWSFGKVTSEMRVRPAPIIRSESPNSRYEIALLIDRPK